MRAAAHAHVHRSLTLTAQTTSARVFIACLPHLGLHSPLFGVPRVFFPLCRTGAVLVFPSFSPCFFVSCCRPPHTHSHTHTLAAAVLQDVGLANKTVIYTCDRPNSLIFTNQKHAPRALCLINSIFLVTPPSFWHQSENKHALCGCVPAAKRSARAFLGGPANKRPP